MEIVLIITLLATICMSLQFSDVPDHYHVPLINIRNVKQTIIYYMGDNDHVVIDSILKNLTNQPFIVVTSDKIPIAPIHSDTNVLMLTDTLNIENFETEIFKTLLSSHWSLLYLVLSTRNTSYACEKLMLYENAFDEVKIYLNELWHAFRIVRIVVTFPYTCPGQYVIYDGKESSSTNLYNRTIKLIKPNDDEDFAVAVMNSGKTRDLTVGYPLQSNIFYRFPTVIADCDVVDQYTKSDYKYNAKLYSFCGMDGMVMQDYISHYKFDLIEFQDQNCYKYGYVDSTHNTITGSLGCIVDEKMDISFNSRFMWPYTNKKFYFLHYVSQDSLCVLTRRAREIPLWHYAANIFSPIIYLALLTQLTFLGIATWLIARIWSKFTDVKPLKLYWYVFYTIRSSMIGVLVKRDKTFLVLKGTSLLLSVMFLAVYQSYVNYQFTTRSHYRDIHTLQQLFHSSTIVYTSHSMRELLKSDAHKVGLDHEEFSDHFQIQNVNIQYLLQNLNTATVGRRKDVMIEVLKYHTDNNGIPLIHIVDDCFHKFYLSFIARKSFLFIEESAKFMMRLLEAGLPNQYYLWTQRSFHLQDSSWKSGSEARPFRNIRVKDLRIAFGILLVGYLVSGLVFVLEKWKGRKIKSESII